MNKILLKQAQIHLKQIQTHTLTNRSLGWIHLGVLEFLTNTNTNSFIYVHVKKKTNKTTNKDLKTLIKVFLKEKQKSLIVLFVVVVITDSKF